MEIEYNKKYKYKQMCELMKSPIMTSTNSKKSQLSECQQYYDIEKNGTFYIIKRKYNDNEVQLLEKNGKFATYICDLIAEHFIKTNQKFCTMTYYELFEMLSMVNEHYHKAKNNQWMEIDKFNDLQIPQQKLEKLNITRYAMIEADLDFLFRKVTRQLKQTVNNSLNIMSKNGYLIVSESFKLYKKSYKDVVFPPKVCNDKETQEILDAQNKALQLIGRKKKQDLNYVTDEEYKTYHEYMINFIRTKYGYDSYSSAVKMIISPTGMQMQLQHNNRKTLNDRIQQKILLSKELNSISQQMIQLFVQNYINIQHEKSTN
jgi:hypothetical protein